MTELCRVCKKANGSLVCPCGRFYYCTPDCLAKSGHLYQCDYQKLDFGHLISIMHSFMPILEAVKEDKELYSAAKEFVLLMRKKLNLMNIDGENMDSQRESIFSSSTASPDSTDSKDL